MTDLPLQKEFWSGDAGEKWAANADRIDAMLRPLTEDALARAGFAAGERVLDIGCGAGATSLRIAQHVQPNGSVTGVDISPQLLRVARARAAGAGLPVEFVEADAGAAKFGDAFDAAFSRFGVMFFDDTGAAFANIRSALRSGGRLFFVCWRPLVENTWATTPIDAIRPMLQAPLTPPDPDAPGPFRLADPNKIERMLADSGWSEVKLDRWTGDVLVGGGGSLEDTAEFLVRIGPCARAIADQGLDANEVRARLMDAIGPRETPDGVPLTAACWLVSARA